METPAPGRPWYKRFTIVFGALTAALLSLEQSGQVPAGITQQVVDLGQNLTGFLTLFGLYRQVAN
jgi:hypothetical protein